VKYIAFMLLFVLAFSASTQAGSLPIQTSITNYLFVGNDNSFVMSGPCLLGKNGVGDTRFTSSNGVQVSFYYALGCGVTVDGNNFNWEPRSIVSLSFSRPIQGIELNLGSDCNTVCTIDAPAFGPSGKGIADASGFSSADSPVVSIFDPNGAGISSISFFVDASDEGPFYYGPFSDVSLLDTASVTPEPGSIILFGTTFLLLLAIRQKVRPSIRVR
jgi:hypothetical protein